MSYSQMENFTGKLRQSTSEIAFWTATPSVRIFKDAAVPDDTLSTIKVYCAKNETEPFVLVVKPSQTISLPVTVSGFNGIELELFQVKFVTISTASDNLGQTGPYPDPIIPVKNGSPISFTSNENTALWITVYADSTVPKGDIAGTVKVGTVSIPIVLHIFNFAISPQLHIHSQMNFSYEAVLNRYGVSGVSIDYWKYIDIINTFFIRHRLTPRNPCWPGGLTSSGGECFIEYDCSNEKLSDADGIWGFEQPSDKYVKGIGFNNGYGFPTFQAITFKNNDASADQRPPQFCGTQLSSSDWYIGNNSQTSYNNKWFSYLNTIQNYLKDRSLIDKAYYYLANEPQDQADYDAVAWYTQEIKKRAPALQLMVSEQPRSEIFNNPVYTSAKVDIWLPVLNDYDPAVAWEREANYHERTWIYFLHGTRPPYFNPITIDHPGIESKLCGWFLWKYRIKGIAYYSMNDWSKNPWTTPLNAGHNGDLFMLYPPSENNTPVTFGATEHRLTTSQRFELVRDGFEDFEYLYILNNNAMPLVNVQNSADTLTNKIISGLISYCRDDEFMYNMRKLIGLKIGGEITAIPEISPPDVHPRSQGNPGNYYLNFQDPAGQPAANPLVINGKTYMKIGWEPWSGSSGYGWFGDLSHVMYQYLSTGPNELQKSIIYDDWGRQKTFEFALPNGMYNVTVSVGWFNKTYSHQKITIEGVSFINGEATTPDKPYMVRTKQVRITDKKLTMEMGIFDEYTMLNYMTIEAVNAQEQKTTFKQSGIQKCSIIRTSKTVLLRFGRTSNKTIFIYNSSGKLLKQLSSFNQEITIEKNKFSSGVYLIHISQNNNSYSGTFTIY